MVMGILTIYAVQRIAGAVSKTRMPCYTDKKTGNFYVEFQYKGTRVKERLPAGAKKQDAERLEVKLKTDLMFQRHGIIDAPAVTFEDFIRDIYGPYADTLDKQRYDRIEILIKALKPFVTGKAMRSIKAADIERFKASRAALLTMHDTVRKPATIEREMSVISSIFTMAVKNDVIDYNPCSRITKLQFDNVQDKVLRREDEDKFFDNMHSGWARDICRMVLNTGLRQNDLMRLTRFQVDRERGMITLTQGKTKRRVIVPLNSVALEIITRRSRKPSELLFPSPRTGTERGTVRNAMKRACERAHIPVLTIRDLRRTFGTRMIENGADAVTTARSLGHSDLRMLPRYARSVDLMQKAVDSLVNPAKKSDFAENEKVKALKRKS